MGRTTSHRATSLPADDARCGWYHTSPPRTPKPAHNGTSRAPWAVLGAGYTGLAAARQLALNFPDDEIILVDAQPVGFGSAGRNAGFAIDLPHDVGAKDYIGDLDTANTILKLNKTGQRILCDLVRQHKIECHLRHCGKYQAAVEKRGIAVLNAYKNGLDKLGEPWEMIAGQELAQHIGTSFYKQALFTPGTVLMQPAALVKGLVDSLPANVSLYENTPITQIDAGDSITLKHAQGRIIADNLLLTNNAFASYFGFLPRRMLPVFLYASLTRVLTADEQQCLGGKPFWGVIPADTYGSTVRRTVDQRILIRNSISFNKDARPRSDYLARFSKHHRRSFERRFPMLPDVEFEYTWSGALAMSQNHEGFFGQLAPNIYGALCCNGLGVTRGTATGVLLADWLALKLRNKRGAYLDDSSDLIDFLLASPGPNKVVPDPFLTLGVNATLCWGQYRAGLER